MECVCCQVQLYGVCLGLNTPLWYASGAQHHLWYASGAEHRSMVCVWDQALGYVVHLGPSAILCHVCGTRCRSNGMHLWLSITLWRASGAQCC